MKTIQIRSTDYQQYFKLKIKKESKMSDELYNLSRMFEESKLEFLNSLVDK